MHGQLASFSTVSALMSRPYLALSQHRLDVWPGLALGGVTQQVHDDAALLDGLVDLEQVLAGHPAILNRLLPAVAVLPHTDDHVQAVVAEVQTLAVALRAVADEGEGVILEVVLVKLSVKVHPSFIEVHGHTRSFSRGQSSRSIAKGQPSSPGAIGSVTAYRRPSPCRQRSQRSSHHGSAARKKRRRPSGQAEGSACWPR